MVECDYEKEINAYTGDDDKRSWLHHYLKDSIHLANRIDIIVSFIMESGVKLLINDLKKAVDKHIPIRILTGKYLNITQPHALYLIKTLLPDVELYFYPRIDQSFHPKAYIFYHDNYEEIYVGSSNMSLSALTSGIEWNYRLNSKIDYASTQRFIHTYNQLINKSQFIDENVLKEYSKNWHRPLISKEIEKQTVTEYKPRGAQIEALYELDKIRKQGAQKALVHAATGIGKTYLSAFDSLKYNRVLFVAHRQEILNQAYESFQNVRKATMGFFQGNQRDYDKDIIFASVATLGKKEYLNNKYFIPDYFDYIVIDEFHHAVSNNYRNIINYFKPQFLLGLTATPERLDGKDIYALCDYNVAYQITLQSAINKGMLAPFHYYGIYDDVDYSHLKLTHGMYQVNDLENLYDQDERSRLIYRHYKKHNSNKALGFCVSKKHADMMADYFNKQGIASCSVYSDGHSPFSLERNDAIKKLKNGQIQVIFSIDMFNEGVDIPEIDMVMFLRPTQSPTVFLQQLGRGLRLSENKDYVNVLDFIGNYKNAGKIPSLLSGVSHSVTPGSYMVVPDYCIVDFDLELIDLFERMHRNSLSVKERIVEEFYFIQDKLQHLPTRVELFHEMDDEIYQLCMKNSKHSPFHNYYTFLDNLNLLDDYHYTLYRSIAYEFLNLIETTSMSKVYKMPVLQSFIRNDCLIQEVSEDQLLQTWKTFFNTSRNYRDLKQNYLEYANIKDQTHLKNIKNNPVKYLIKSGKGFFVEGQPIKLSDELVPYLNDSLFIHEYKDIIDYRILHYYHKRLNED